MASRLLEAHRLWLVRRFGNRVHFEVPMAPHTSFRIGGAAEALVIPESLAELTALVTGAWERGMDYQVMGGGTNLLVTDAGISGVVILMNRCLGHLEWVASGEKTVTLRAGAGVPLRRLCRLCINRGLKGMNFAIGIPGTVGGALIMNAGTAAGCMADALLSMELLTGEAGLTRLGREMLQSEHRRLSWKALSDETPGRHPAIIVEAAFGLSRGDGAALRAEAAGAMRHRSASQPLGIPSAGCIFKNPVEGPAAGWLIERVGLKGVRRGGACVSERHANFIVNVGGATAADVLSLMDLIRETVWDRFHIQLEPEVKIVGD
jgi:UDP-N-acetylmuramate dehydrogenase